MKVCLLSTKTIKSKLKNRHYIVAIGASAGGLEALQHFFQYFDPTPDFSFVIVQHLAPDHETMLPDLLGKLTSAPVQKVANKTPVEPGNVYIIPPNATMTIKESVLYITEPIEARGYRTPIDSFFISLANDQGNNAISIILSGTGSDGTLGIKAIKEKGGLTIVQSPDSAKYDSMPRNAIASGQVDYQLDVEDIPNALKEYVLHFGYSIPGQTPIAAEAASILEKVCDILRRKTGYDFREYKKSTLIRRIQRRMAIQKIASGKEYLLYLKQMATEAKALFEDFLIGVTFFFRDAPVFKKLAENIIPHIIDKTQDSISKFQKIRVWVVGCATGEEAYSLAILFKEYLDRINIRAEVQIFATDIDENAIDRARRAKYPEGIAEHVSADRLKRYFVKVDHGYTVIKEIRDMCLFSIHDITRDPPFAHIDLLSCRNMLIYLDSNLQKKIVPVFNYALKDHGLLVLGSAENVSSYPEGFIEIDRQNKIWQCVKNRRRPPVLFASDYSPKNMKSQFIVNEVNMTKQKDISEEVRKLIVDHIAPPSIVINKDMNVVFVIGAIEKFLQLATGTITTNLYQLAKDELKYDLRTALSHAFKSKSAISQYDESNFCSGPDKKRIRIEIRKIKGIETKENLFLISFLEISKVKIQTSNNDKKDNRDSAIINSLESELKQTKIYLQSTIEETEIAHEELKSSNEELLSMNEELQSTNEELQTSQEELQSVNEELETVNAELHLKLEELDGANSDLQNLLTSIRIATFFLDGNKCIKRYTPETKQILNILDSDVGRPFMDIAGGVFPFDIRKEIEKVLYKLESFEQEFYLEKTSKSYLVRILPYRSVKNVIAGVVITLSDITTIKEAEVQLRTTKERLDAALKGGRCGYFDFKFDPDQFGLYKENFYSDEILALIGFKKEEFAGDIHEEWKKRIHPDDNERVMSDVKTHIQNAKTNFSIEYRIKHKNGQYIWLMTQDTMALN